MKTNKHQPALFSDSSTTRLGGPLPKPSPRPCGRLVAALSLVILCLAAINCHAWEPDQPPKIIESPMPSHPFKEHKNNATVYASVVMEVDKEGVAKIKKIMCFAPGFGDAIRKAVAGWKFKNATRDGKPFTVLVGYIFIFDPDADVKMIGPLYED